MTQARLHFFHPNVLVLQVESWCLVGFTGDLGSFLRSKTPQPETQDSLQTPSQSSDLCTAPVAAANWGPCLRRNVVSERERRCGQSQGGQYASAVEFRSVV